MDATRAFKDTIQAYLREMAAYDTNFAERLADPKKNINDCVTYILNQVQESGTADLRMMRFTEWQFTTTKKRTSKSASLWTIFMWQLIIW